MINKINTSIELADILDEESDDEWYFVDSVPFIYSSKRFLSYNCRVVLSKLGYYLEVTGDYIKLGDYPKGFNDKQGSVWIKKPINSKGYRIVHDIEKDYFLIGYIREEGNKILYTNKDNQEFSITFDD